jgi:hypothetical protein
METPKPSKKIIVSTSIIVLAVVVLIVAGNAFIWKGRLAKSSEIDSLTVQLAQVKQGIRNTPALSPDLQARLSAATANLTAAQTVLPQQFDPDDLIEYIIALSRVSSVEVLPITSGIWAADPVNPSRSVLRLTCVVTGSFNKANDFIDSLQNGRYKALLTTGMSFTRVPGTPSDGDFSGASTKVTVSLNISVYAVSILKGTGL